MTVALGLVCSDGVVVASDSMGTSGNVAREMPKVFAIEGAPVVWTSSGTVYIAEEIERELRGLEEGEKQFLRTPNLDALRTNLSTHVRSEMKKAYESALPMGLNVPVGPRGALPHPFHTDFIFAGYANATAFLLEIAGDGQLNWHHEHRFLAIGSGGEFATVAQGLMAHLVEESLTVDLGLLVAHRTIDTTCRVSSSLVGPPVQLAAVTVDGAKILTPEDVVEVGVSVDRWIELEKSALRGTGETALEEETLESVPDLAAEEHS